jgi:heme exporter protein B
MSESGWLREIQAVLLKELRSEVRSKAGISTSLVFAASTIVTISLALYNHNANRNGLNEVCASLIWIVLIFISLLSLPRTFLVEEEQGTADLLRLVARPHAVFWGKLLFSLVELWLMSAIVSVFFVGLTGLTVTDEWLFALSIVSGSIGIAGAVTLCGAIASKAANRAALAAAIAIPLIVGPTQWGVTGLQSALGAIQVDQGWRAAAGLGAYGVLTAAIGPWIYAAIWKS